MSENSRFRFSSAEEEVSWPPINPSKGVDVLKVAVLLYTKEDYWAGYDVAVKHGNT